MSAQRNPKDSMKSTWRTADKSTWGWFHKQYDLLSLHHTDLNFKVPVHEKTDKIPIMPQWETNRWVIFHALMPIIVHELLAYVLKRNLSAAEVVVTYTLSFLAIGIHQINMMRRLGQRYGFLDGDKHDRDGIPDHSVAKVLLSLLATVSFREALAVYLTYDAKLTPLQTSWYRLPLTIGLYGITLDFWFYWYHRVMHQSETLWSIHRTHHLTKHPNPLLTLYADETQEIIDIVGMPLITFLTLKAFGLSMSYYEWWFCYQYVVFAELLGHSGLRIHATAPSPFYPLLVFLGWELVVEDHDLHHRKGWKESHNYGKQTRMWDSIFGTTTERIESQSELVDYDQTAHWPLL